MYVQNVVPKEDLLVWNLKDGWTPLCNFLGKPIPDEPIPHENKSFDKEWMQNYGYEHKMFIIAKRHIAKNVLLFVLKSLIAVYIFIVFFSAAF